MGKLYYVRQDARAWNNACEIQLPSGSPTWSMSKILRCSDVKCISVVSGAIHSNHIGESDGFGKLRFSLKSYEEKAPMH